MKCVHAAEVKARLLSPRFRLLLQRYTDRWKSDPAFLVYHRESTVLALRQELGSSMAATCCNCASHQTGLVDCCMTDALRDAMKELISTQDVHWFQ